MTIHPVASTPPLARILESAAPRQDCVARLLLLLARTSLTEVQTTEVRRPAEGVSDWKELALLAARKFVATYAYMHLSAGGDHLVQLGDLELLRRLSYASTMSSLRAAAAQLAFHKSCIASTGASHAYLKGAALAAQTGQDVGARPARDIDVLVADSDFRQVLDPAIAADYSIFIDVSRSERAISSRDIDFSPGTHRYRNGRLATARVLVVAPVRSETGSLLIFHIFSVAIS